MVDDSKDTESPVNTTETVIYDNDLVVVSKSVERFVITNLYLTPQCILFGTASGHLLVFNRRLAKLAKPVYCTSSPVSCMNVFISEDNFIHVILGHASGALSFVKLPSANSSKLHLHFDVDVHKSHEVESVVWGQVNGKNRVFSCDSDGLIIVSDIDFDSKLYSHTFFHFTPSVPQFMIYHKSFLYFSSGSDLNFLHVEVEDEVRTLDSIPNLVGLHALVESVLLISSNAVRLLSSSEGFDKEKIRTVSTIQTSAVNCDSSKLALISKDSVGIWCLNTWRPLWNLQLLQIPSIFSLDVDGSLFYMSEQSLRRVSSTIAPENLVVFHEDNNRSGSSFSDLFGSPKRFLNLSAMQKAGAVVNNVVTSAVDFSNQAEVPKLLEDGLQRMNIPGKIGAVVQTVQEYVDTANTNEIIEGLPYVPNRQSAPSYSNSPKNSPQRDNRFPEERGFDASLPVTRRMVGKAKKKSEEPEERPDRAESEIVLPVESELDEQTDNQEQDPSDSLKYLRRQVLGYLHEDEVPSSPSPTKSMQSEENGPVTNADTVASTLDVSDQEPSNSADEGLNSEETPKEKVCASNDTEPVTSSPKSIIEPISINNSVDDVDYRFSPDLLSPRTASMAYDLLMKEAVKSEAKALSTIPAESPKSELKRRSLIRKAVRVNDNCDIWTEIPTPFTVTSFSLNSSHLIMCHRKKKPKFAQLEQLGSKNCGWQQVKWEASDVQLADTFLLRLFNEIIYHTISIDNVSSPKWSPISCAGGRVLEAEMTGTDLWYLSEELGISLLMEVPDQCIFSPIECEWKLCSLAVSENAVWAIRADKGTLLVRVGLNRCRMGYDWIEVSPEGPSSLVSVTLFESSGFALDSEGDLWMVAGVDQHHPYGNSDAWLKISHPWDLTVSKVPIGEWKLRVTSSGVFVSAGKILYFAATSVSGHRFALQMPAKCEVLDNFSMIAAKSLSFDSHELEDDAIFLCRPNSEVFVYRPRRKHLATLSLPQGCNAIVNLSCHKSTVSIVDSAGVVWSRSLNDNEWTKEEGLGAYITSYAQSPLGTWVVTSEGGIVCRPNGEEKWRVISTPVADSGSRIDQISCSPNGRYIWIGDGVRGWARTDVTDRMPTGIKWTETHHPSPLCSFAVGDDVIFSLSDGGLILRLKGLAAGNPAGNYWKTIGKGLRSISVDSHSGLWALNDDNRLVRHLTDIFPPQPKSCAESESNSFEVI